MSVNGDHETLWNKLVPKKVNIFVWRALRGRLPVRVELDRRGIDLDSVLCPSCNNLVETCAHCLITCDLAMMFGKRLFGLPGTSFGKKEMFACSGKSFSPTASQLAWCYSRDSTACESCFSSYSGLMALSVWSQ
ncbi:RNA-directed DNA polymerase, eukaryota, reverse transcriptase zinc-binding domain protein, partial [Tanacetum coccineum]